MTDEDDFEDEDESGFSDHNKMELEQFLRKK